MSSESEPSPKPTSKPTTPPVINSNREPSTATKSKTASSTATSPKAATGVRVTKSNLEAYIRLELKLRPTTLLLLTIKVDSGAHNLLNIKLDLTKYLLHTAKRFPLVKFLRGLWQLFFCLTSDL